MRRIIRFSFFFIVLSIFLLEITFGFSMGYHYDLIREVMRGVGFNKDAFSLALVGNSYVDIFQEKAVEYVIDDDFCRVSKKLVDFLHFDNLYNEEVIERYWKQLIFNTYNAMKEKVNKNDKLGALLIIGISLHIVQDFYAHSNWVELNLSSYSKIKDATYFDVLKRAPNDLIKAIEDVKKRGGMYFNVNRLTTFWGKTNHDVLNKDHAGRPLFDSAYRTSYKASLEWLRLIKKWVTEDFNNSKFWNEILIYDFKEGNKKHLYTLTDFDEGTIRWLCTYGGAWKAPRIWGSLDIVFDDMPNVPGIGLTSQNSPDYPFLGIEWFSNCTLIAKDLFEASYKGGFIKVHSIDKLEEGMKKRSDFGEIVKVNWEEVQNLAPLDNSIIREAFSFLGNCTIDYEKDVKWLRVRIPEAMDLDTGKGWDNINNEEPGGDSDYWVMFVVNNEVDYPYTEAEYVDKSHPFPVWGILKPLWDLKPVRIQIRMYESDSGFRGSQHKDEEMDIRPGTGKDFLFEFNPKDFSYNAISGMKVWNIIQGYYIRSYGEGDLRARVYVKIWMMEDIPQEIPLYPVFFEDKNCDGAFLPIFDNIDDLSKFGFNDRISSIFLPFYTWKLEVYEDKNYKGRKLFVESTIQDLHSDDFKMGDKISSVKIIKASIPSYDFPIFYEDKNYKGYFLKLPYNLPNNSICGFYSELSIYKFNDRISSIKIPNGWKVIIYENSHFEGKNVEITSSIADLSTIGWNDRVSSIRVIPPFKIAEDQKISIVEPMKPLVFPMVILDKNLLIDLLKLELKNFPEKYVNQDFYYKREDIKIPDDIDISITITYINVKENFAYVEGKGENYYLNFCSLLYREQGEWEVKEIVNADYVVCDDKYEGLDIYSWIYEKLKKRYLGIPIDIFPKIHPERKIMLSILREKISNLVSDNIGFLVEDFKEEREIVKMAVRPRSLDGVSQYEILYVTLKKDKDKWNIVNLK